MDSIFSQSITDIGQVLGYPAMLLIFWLYIKVKDTEKRLQRGDSDMKEMLKIITDIRIDVAVFRKNFLCPN